MNPGTEGARLSYPGDTLSRSSARTKLTTFFGNEVDGSGPPAGGPGKTSTAIQLPEALGEVTPGERTERHVVGS